MTVINGIEIDFIEYEQNDMKQAIINNEPIEENLHVIAVVSNAGLFARRYILTKEFLDRIDKEEPNVITYVVELAYEKQQFIITDSKNPQHLQLRVNTPLWHKENLVNVAVKQLLPKGWKAFAWIDADIEFENVTWAKDTLKILNGSKDIVQIFSHALDMDMVKNTMKIFSSFGYQYTKKKQYISNGNDYWHPGYGWAITRKAYERIGGLYEYAILGSGDNIMALSIIENGLKSINDESTDDYKDSILEYQRKIRTLRLGYVPGVIRHHFHGSKKNRKYNERWRILLDHNYSPTEHITRNNKGILVPTQTCPPEIIEKIKSYFFERNDDEGYAK